MKEELIEMFSEIVKTDEFTLSSGKKSNFYIDCKEILLMPNVMKIVSSCVWRTHQQWINPNYCYHYVAGITSGADPIVCGLVNNYFMNGLFIRKAQKGYGTKKLIEGRFEDRHDVIIVDDVLTTGGSIKYAYDVLTKHFLRPCAVVVLVDRQENDAVANLEKYTSVPIISITTKEEIFQYLNNGDLY